MSLVIRDVQQHELPSVLALNNSAGPGILALDMQRLQRFHEQAEYFRICERAGQLAGFLVAFGPESGHDSANFLWFCTQVHEPFLYIDRVVVASQRRGGGVGRAFYADVQSYAELRYPQLTCEVFLGRANDPVLLFHGSSGFREIGQRVQDDGTRAAMLMKSLCSHAWIKDTYGMDLPNETWVGCPHHSPSSRPTAHGAHAS